MKRRLLQDLLMKLSIMTLHIFIMNTVPIGGIYASDHAFQQLLITGRVTAEEGGEGLPGVNVVIKGTTQGTATDANGAYSLEVPSSETTLVFSAVGRQRIEVQVGNRTKIDIALPLNITTLEEVVVVGYGTQKKSDITGSVASLQQERLENVPNLNLAQAIQGAIPGVSVLTTTAGAAPSNGNQSIMIRGRNSIKANNEPLIVVDGIAYRGDLTHLNPNDIKSIEILKDASAAAIYGSRGANGVILVTTKQGTEGKPKISYNGYYSVQQYTNIPTLMTGDEFYEFKMIRNPDYMTQSEIEMHESGEWTDWLDIALRNGASTQHNVSVSGGFKDTHYYISAGVTDVRGLAVNDDYLRLTSRVNLDTKIANWLTIGTRTQFISDDRSGVSPTWSGDQGIFLNNPLTRPYDENGELTIYPWPEQTYFRNPLMGTLADDVNRNYQIVSNNFVIVDLPFVPGLQYRINAGFRVRLLDRATYYGRNTQLGLVNGGDANTNRVLYNNDVIENILNYNKAFGKHSVFLTGVYSFEKNKNSGNRLGAEGFPHDFLTWYAAGQAELVVPDYSYSSTNLISQMVRLNYSYDSRFLFTLTGRRDGYSGFGTKTKWGIFPSMAFGWNLVNESFFPWGDVINDLKLRLSWGRNGNQAVGAYESISRLSERNYISGSTTLPGYIPSVLGADNLGWESTETVNIGLDFGILSNRIVGDINVYRARTSDLLLDRTISPIHGITQITQNIGETENRGFEFSVTSRNVTAGDFAWKTTANMSYIKNEIVSLYGELDEDGNEIDDVGSRWFIGHPVLVNYGYVWDGVWQLDQEAEAESFGSQPGFIKIKDISGPDGVPDGEITADDRTIIGQRDPRFMWGMNNSLTYKGISLNVFVHGVHGMTKVNPLLTDGNDEAVTKNTTKKNWWTPENPTNEWYMNKREAQYQNGVSAPPYEKADFIRVKDITLSYDLKRSLLQNSGFDKFEVYATGRNLFTFTKYGGLDPELGGQQAIPLQKEYVLGINFGF